MKVHLHAESVGGMPTMCRTFDRTAVMLPLPLPADAPFCAIDASACCASDCGWHAWLLALLLRLGQALDVR